MSENVRFSVRVKQGVWTREGQFQNAAGDEYLTMVTLLRLPQFERLARNTVERCATSTPSRFLRDKRGRARKIATLLVEPPGPRNVAKVRVYLKEDLETIIKVLNAGESVYTDEDGRWPTDRQCQQIHGVSYQYGRVWSSRESRLRPGQKALRSKPVPNPRADPGRGVELPGRLESDLLLILDGAENEHAGVGKGVVAAGLREKKRQLALEAVRALAPLDQRVNPAGVIALASHQYGLTSFYVRRAAKLLRVIVEKEGKPGGGTRYWWRRPALPSESCTGQKTPTRASTNHTSIHNSEKTRRGPYKGSRNVTIVERIRAYLKQDYEVTEAIEETALAFKLSMSAVRMIYYRSRA